MGSSVFLPLNMVIRPLTITESNFFRIVVLYMSLYIYQDH